MFGRLYCISTKKTQKKQNKERLRMKNMLDKIVNRFNSEGIFPSDYEMSVAVQESDEYSDEFELEMKLIDMASENVNHPYHLNVTVDVSKYSFNDPYFIEDGIMYIRGDSTVDGRITPMKKVILN
jgi:hypothetical protein